MKTMKTISLTTLMALLTLGGFSQHFFARAGFGGAIGVASTSSYLTIRNTESAGSTGTIERFPVAFGNGFNFNAAFGSNFTKYFGAELGFNYFMGLPLSGTSKTTYPESMSTDKVKVYGMMLQVVPAFIISPGLEKFNPYMKFGAIIGVLPIFYQENTITGQMGNISSELFSKRKFYGSIAIGFTTSAGCEFNLKKLITFYAEVNFNGIDYSPSKASQVTYTVDGEDRLSTLSTYAKETEFVTSKQITSTPPMDQPAKVLKQSYPFSNVSMNFGVKFRFGKMKS